jgi:clan AA aspartic protease (TIGR02281 family)
MKRRPYLAVPLLVFGLLAPSSAATIYKCKNPEGKLVYQETPCAKQHESVSSWVAKQEIGSGETAVQVVEGMLVIPQHPSGHYFVPGSINGKALTFVIDTGASAVVLPREFALSAGIYCRDKILMNTVNGTASGCVSVAPKLKFGPFTLTNVPVMIAPQLNQPLLGMNLLQQFKIQQESGVMRISHLN